MGQNIQARAADKRSEDTYKDAEAVLKESEEIQKHLLAQDEAISNILERLETLMAATREVVVVVNARGAASKRREQLSASQWALATTTTIVNVHRGSVLPEARVIVIAVPVTLLRRLLVRAAKGRRPK